MQTQCLFCYQPILAGEAGTGLEFHSACSKRFFGTPIPPVLNYLQSEIVQLALETIRSQQTVTGVQPKLSLSGEKSAGASRPHRLTLVGLWGDYILKPQTAAYEQLPENEDLTMHLAAAAGIQTVEHALIRLKSGELAYITKRIDRVKKQKRHMEDMCQLTERLTEAKYRGSHEQIAKTIRRFSALPGLDVINFYERVIFSFLTGNNDMHLKNFSLLKTDRQHYELAPAYDLVASTLVLPDDDEELALTLNGKKKHLSQINFIQAMTTGGIPAKSIENSFSKFNVLPQTWHTIIESGFLQNHLKAAYHTLIDSRFHQLGLTR